MIKGELLLKKVAKVADGLSEHFNALVIMVSVDEPMENGRVGSHTFFSWRGGLHPTMGLALDFWKRGTNKDPGDCAGRPLVEDALVTLGKDCDTVVILAEEFDAEMTPSSVTCKVYHGSYYAALGLVAEFLYDKLTERGEKEWNYPNE